ncbi:DUF4838 domain-containing protein [Ruficoccus sp. ZRK36]|uniref:DUF4838 domain-containing protein n=1 Tax=Ruficoccus sp. ZRK36 TaxID=2866311 RepID=UPI001C732640|nr:DUF4838 domain-containing protein [Ruficoccus sp. ZRK36]QYY36556.1 DUF4838 domain-containing protein [Ruficoccus sp. ZRK36]
MSATEAAQASPSLVIVEASAPEEWESDAAALMADTLEKIYPGKIERVSRDEAPDGGLKIYLGQPPEGIETCGLEGVDPDGFALIGPRIWQPRVGPRRTPFRVARRPRMHEPEWIAVVGASPLGTYYGSAWLLREHYGVQWLFPGEDGLDLPTVEPPLLPRDRGVIEPSFIHRRLGHDHGEPYKSWRLLNGLNNRFQINHNLHKLTEPEVFAAHPEWQSYARGKKQTRVTSTGVQPNLVSTGYREYIADRVRAHWEGHPDDPGVSLGITDSVSFDETEQTRVVVEPFTYFRNRPNYSDLVFGFTNAVAVRLFEDEEFGDRFADKSLSQLAYYYAEEVPDIELHPQIIPWLTSDRAQWFDPNYRSEDEALIRRWSRMGLNMIGTWDYYEGIPFFIPRYYPTLIAESIKYLHAHDGRGFFAEGIANPGIDDPKYWLAAQLLWDVDQDPERLQEEFFQRCYKASAVPMRRFFDLCEQAWMDQPPPGSWIKYFTSPSQAELFPPELCKRMRACLDEAMSMAESDLVRRRIERVSASFRVAEVASERYEQWKTLAAQAHVSPGEKAAFEKGFEPLNAVIKDKWKRSMGLYFLLYSDPTDRGAAPPEGATKILDEDFESLMVPDGRIVASTYPGYTLENQGERKWMLNMRHTQDLRIEQASGSAYATGEGLRIEGGSYYRMLTELEVTPGTDLYLRAWVRGRVSGETQVFLQLALLDADGKMYNAWNIDALSLGEHDWLPLTVKAHAGQNIPRVQVGFIIMNQAPGDWIDVDDIVLYQGLPEPN